MDSCLIADGFASPILERTHDDFYASENFRLRGESSDINIVWIGVYFRQRFMIGKMDKAEPARNDPVAIYPYRLTRDSLGREIELAAQEAKLKKVWLMDIHELISRQMEGEDGLLDTGGENNLFFANDNLGTCHVVHAKYSSKYRGWGIGACPVQLQDEEDYVHAPKNAPCKWYSNRRCLFKRGYDSFD
jgi:hypothetical protein